MDGTSPGRRPLAAVQRKDMRDSERGHETFEHTADMGLRGWGPDGKSAICEAAALFELMRGEETPEPDMAFDLEVEEHSLGELLVELLNRVISILDLNEARPVDIIGASLEPRGAGFRMRAGLRASRRSGPGERHGSEVKAAAGYGADVKRGPDAIWEAVCVVDM